MTESKFDIRPVDSPKGWKDFYRVRRDIYKNDPAAVIPLRSFEFALLDDQRHPFYQHAQRQAFVAYRNAKPIARIVAVKDDMHNEYYDDRVGFFGFFECPNEQPLANALLETAKRWLLERNLNVMRGPVNPSMKSDFGVLVEGHEHPPFIMMAHSTNYYANLLETAGLQVVRKFLALLLKSADGNAEGMVRLKRLQKFAARVSKRYPTLEMKFANSENVGELIRQINVVGNEIRSEGWGFVPMTDAELDFMVSQVKRIINPETVLVAYVNGELAGYHVSIPDVNWAFKRTRGPDWLRMIQMPYWLRKIRQSRCIALGASKKYRHTGIGVLLVQEMTELMNIMDQWEFSWIDSENTKSIAAVEMSVPSKHYKTYHLYEMKIGE